MSLEDFLVTVISAAGVSAVLVGLLLWLTKEWIGERLKNAIKAEYDAKLETHKAQLKSQADVDLEKLKSFLAVTAAEQNTAFAKLHDRRFDVIANTYALLWKLHDCVTQYVKLVEFVGEPSKEERRHDAVNAYNEFKPYFNQNQIFLPKRIADLIERANMELVQITNSFTFLVDRSKTPDVDKWMQITEKLDKEFKQALADLENELRKALGDKS